MKSLNLNQPFAELVNDEAEKHPRILTNYKKVCGVLKAYAEERGMHLASLSLVHICHDRDWMELNPALAAFISRLVGTQKYKSEVRSRLRRIIKTLSGMEDQGCAESTPMPTPEVLGKVLAVLPRQNCNAARGRARVPYKNLEKRLTHPLTDNSQQLLLVLVRVVEKNAIADLDVLLIEHRDEIKRTIKQTLPPRTWANLYTTLIRVLKALGYPIQRAPKQRIDPPDWPPTLRQQFERFLELAPRGINHDLALVKRAAENKVEVIPLEEATRRRYISTLSTALGHILPRVGSLRTDLGVRDLMIIQKEPCLLDGVQMPSGVNPFTELYRRREMDRVSTMKNAGFDSGSFNIYTTAVKALAAFNGHFDLHKDFNAAYKVNTDTEQKKINKAVKKELFDLPWIDSEMARMLENFRRIVKQRSFKFECPDKTAAALWRSSKDMQFCLFFVIFVTLRYMGHRQQVIRNCEVGRGKNVAFNDDGSIHFNWKARLVKNDWELDQVLKEWEHQTHKIMVEVLTTYYKVIYRPYILKNCATGPDGRSLVENQLFVYLVKGGKFLRFCSDNQTQFDTRFRCWSLEFLDFGGRANVLGRGINPHFFRGLAVDWMVNERRVPLDKAAEFFGITVQTLVNDYLRAVPKKSAGAALEAANAEQKAMEVKAREEELKRKINEMEIAHKEELTRKDELLEKKEQRIYELQDHLIEVLKKVA